MSASALAFRHHTRLYSTFAASSPPALKPLYGRPPSRTLLLSSIHPLSSSRVDLAAGAPWARFNHVLHLLLVPLFLASPLLTISHPTSSVLVPPEQDGREVCQERVGW